MTRKALLIFAKEPVPGQVKTRLTPFLSPEAAAEIYRCMLLDTLSKAAALQDVTPFLFINGGEEAEASFRGLAAGITTLPQTTGDLGQRMKNAFTTVFGLGYQLAAVIGTDSPDLPLAYLHQAFARLLEEPIGAVFGPSDDGGYYLLAVKGVHRPLFENITWSSEMVLAESLAAAGKAGIVTALLPAWHDIDTAADLMRPELQEGINGAHWTRDFLCRAGLTAAYFKTSNP